MQLQSPFSALTPTVDGDVLDVLARADRSFTLSDLQRLVPTRSYVGLLKAADRLTEQGTVLLERVGRSRVYRLNRDHLLADSVIAIATARARFIDRLRGRCSGLPLVYGALFGSGARGDMRADSDIDLFFVPSDQGKLGVEERLLALAEEVRRWTGNPVNPIVYDAEGVTADDPLVASVHREGLVIAGESRWLSQRMRRTTR